MKELKIGLLIQKSNQINCSHFFCDHLSGISDFCQNKLKTSEICTASFDFTMNVYDLDSMKMTSRLTEHTQGVWTIDYSTSDNLLASGSNDNSVILWDTKTYKSISMLCQGNEVIYDIKFSNNGKFLAACCKGRVYVWDVSNLSKPLAVIEEEKNEFIYCVNFLNFDQYVITGLINGDLVMFNIQEGSEAQRIRIEGTRPAEYLGEEEKIENAVENSIYCISKFKKRSQFVDDQILITHSDGSIMLLELQNGKLVKKDNNNYQYFGSPVTCINSSFNDEHLIAGSKDRFAHLWASQDFDKVSYTLVGHSNVITAADFLFPDIVATSSYDNTLRIWKL